MTNKSGTKISAKFLIVYSKPDTVANSILGAISEFFEIF